MVSRSASSGGPRTILTIFAISAFILLYWCTSGTSGNSEPASAASLSDMMSSDSIVASLKVSVRQTSVSPPKLAVAVTNEEPAAGGRTATVLKWDSPLDPLSLQLGLLELTPEGSPSPLDIATIQARRMMPPGKDQFAEIAPGETAEQEVLLRKPIVPVDELAGKKVGVVCRGGWSSVWPLPMAEVPSESMEKGSGSSDALKGSFKSKSVDIQL